MRALIPVLAAAWLTHGGPASAAMDAQDVPADANPPGRPSAIPVLAAGTPLELEVVGGQRYEGAFVGIEDPILQLSTRDGVVDIPLPAVVVVNIDGVPYSTEAFREGARQWGQALLDEALRVPHPFLAGASSVLWAGAGPAVLGDRKSAFAYTILEISFIGAGAVMISNEQYGPLLPLAALDVMLHVWAGAESVRESKRRRSRAKLVLAPAVVTLGGSTPVVGLGLVLRAGAPESSVSKGALPSSASCGEPGLTGPCSFPY